MIAYLTFFLEHFYKLVITESLDEVSVGTPKLTCYEEEGYCEKIYTISLKGLDLNDKALVVGLIHNNSVWSCGDMVIYSTGYTDSYQASRHVMNHFNIIPKRMLSTCKSDNLSVKVNYPLSKKKNGILRKSLILTEENTAYRFQRMYNFATKDYKLLNFCTMVFLFIFSFLISAVLKDKSSKIRKILSASLMLAGVAQIGVIEIFFPTSFGLSLNVWFGMLSVCSLCFLGLTYLTKFESKKKIILICSIILLSTLVVTESKITTWIYFFYIMGAVGLILSVYEKNVRLFIYGAFVFMSAMEFDGYKGLPNPYIVPTYLAILIFIENHRAFSYFLRINRIMRLGNDRRLNGRYAANQMNVNAIIKLFQRYFNVDRVTLLNIVEPENISMNQYSEKSMNPSTTFLKELPPVFAHVVTTGNVLENVRADSELVNTIKQKKEEYQIESSYFTVLPLYSGTQIIGAISITSYNDECFKTPLARSTFIFCLEMLKGILVEAILTTPKTDSLNKLSKLNLELDKIITNESLDVDQILASYGKVLNKTFGWRVAGFNLDPKDYRLRMTSAYNFNEAVEHQIRNGVVYASKENKQGPIALAVHERKPVIVPNTKWLEGVVHKYTIKFFTIHKTKTAAFIPVLNSNQTEVLGVFWIEGTRSSEITYADREMFNTLINKISIQLEQVKINESLSSFIPENLVSDYLAGKEVSEKDFGFLLMFDLKGSTRLARSIGEKTFRSAMENLKNKVSESLGECGWILRDFLWDAIEFTKSDNPSECKVEDIEALDIQIEEVFQAWLKTLIQTLGNKVSTEGLGYRLCLGYGDISRGIVFEGSTQKWGFKNLTIAKVHKLEQKAKSLEGKVFCDRTVISKTCNEWEFLYRDENGVEVHSLKPIRIYKNVS